jgi:DNA-binding transcriptional ArsR family regulator
MVSVPTASVSDPRWIRAISHPLRVRLLALLDEQAASPVVLAGKLNQSLGTVSYHVRTLYELGLLDLVSTRQRRGATEHIYRARAHPPFTERSAALETQAGQRTVGAALDEIHDHASRSAAAGGFDHADAQFVRTPLKLDEQGKFELAQATRSWLQKAAGIEREAAERLAQDARAALDVGLVVLFFEALPFSAAERS